MPGLIHNTLVYLSLLMLLPVSNDINNSGLGRYLWRGEYTRALRKSDGQDNRTRARLMLMAGSPDTAYILLEGEDDEFRKGLAAYRAEKYREALEHLSHPVDNSMLEAYRYLTRGRIFFRDSLYESSAAASEKILQNYRGSRIAQSELYGEACDILVTSCINASYNKDLINYIHNYELILSPPVKIKLSRFCLDRGMPEEAFELYRQAVKEGTGGSPVDLTGRLVPKLKELSNSRLAGITSDLLKNGQLESAGLVADIVKQRGSPYLADYLKGRILEESGRPVQSSRIFKRLFNSGADVELKKDALNRMSKIAYRKGRYGKAVRYYRTFGMYYPGDSRSVRSLDIAARLEIARGNYENAIRIWDKMPATGNNSARVMDAHLSSAVTSYFINNKQRAYRVLKDLLERTGYYGRDAVLYWLHQTCPDSERDYWLDNLIREYPRSFYSRAAQGGKDLFIFSRVKNTIIDLQSLHGAELAEKSFYDSLDTSTDGSSIGDNYLYKAYRYFLINGFYAEARLCVELLMDMFLNNRDALLEICRFSRREGFLYPVLSILHSAEFYGPGRNIPQHLRYPIAYTDLIYENCRIRKIPPELAMAVIRAESSFDHRAISRAGALGLMQFMPSTAYWIGERMGDDGVNGERIYSPEFNIRAGIYYLDYLLSRNGDSVVAALAAYNAGNSKMSPWRKRFSPGSNPVLAIEMIGINETRNYVKKVLNFMSMYSAITGAEYGRVVQ